MLSLMKNCLFVQGLEGAGSEEQEEGVRLEKIKMMKKKTQADLKTKHINNKQQQQICIQKKIQQTVSGRKIERLLSYERVYFSQRPGRYHNEEDGS